MWIIILIYFLRINLRKIFIYHHTPFFNFMVVTSIKLVLYYVAKLIDVKDNGYVGVHFYEKVFICIEYFKYKN